MLSKSIIILIALSSGFAHATDIDVPLIEDTTRSLVDHSFPEIRGLHIELVPFHSKSDFFKTDVAAGSIFRKPKNRHYRIHYNPAVLAQLKDVDALEAILAHELQHICDYYIRFKDDLLGFALLYVFGDVAAYEHETDLAAMKKGYAPGLKKYRIWLYEQVSPRVAKEKKRTYYTPDEIDEYLSQVKPH